MKGLSVERDELCAMPCVGEKGKRGECMPLVIIPPFARCKAGGDPLVEGCVGAYGPIVAASGGAYEPFVAECGGGYGGRKGAGGRCACT